jgi:hypothetical protein
MPKLRVWYLFPAVMVAFVIMVVLTSRGADTQPVPGGRSQTETKPAKPTPDPYEEAQKEADRELAEYEARRARERAAMTPEERAYQDALDAEYRAERDAEINESARLDAMNDQAEEGDACYQDPLRGGC